MAGRSPSRRAPAGSIVPCARVRDTLPEVKRESWCSSYVGAGKSALPLRSSAQFDLNLTQRRLGLEFQRERPLTAGEICEPASKRNQENGNHEHVGDRSTTETVAPEQRDYNSDARGTEHANQQPHDGINRDCGYGLVVEALRELNNYLRIVLDHWRRIARLGKSIKPARRQLEHAELATTARAASRGRAAPGGSARRRLPGCRRERRRLRGPRVRH